MLAKETIAIAPFIQELAKPFQEIAKMNNKQFVLENLATTTAVFDPKKIHQVLVILLDNALKYTSQGDKITLLSEISNKYWLLEVRNTGPSISDEDKKHPVQKKPAAMVSVWPSPNKSWRNTKGKSVYVIYNLKALFFKSVCQRWDKNESHSFKRTS